MVANTTNSTHEYSLEQWLAGFFVFCICCPWAASIAIEGKNNNQFLHFSFYILHQRHQVIESIVVVVDPERGCVLVGWSAPGFPGVPAAPRVRHYHEGATLQGPRVPTGGDQGSATGGTQLQCDYFSLLSFIMWELWVWRTFILILQELYHIFTFISSFCHLWLYYVPTQPFQEVYNSSIIFFIVLISSILALSL